MNNEILSNLYRTIQEFWVPMNVFGVFIGFVLFGMALISLAKLMQSHGSQGSLGRVAGLALGGLLLLNTSSILSMVSTSLLGGENINGFSAAVNTSDGQMYIQVAVAAVKMIGFFGFIRGCYLLSCLREGGGCWPGIIHIIGGVLCLNFEVFAIMLADTLGGVFSEIINQLF